MNRESLGRERAQPSNKNTFCKANKIIFESEIDSKETAANTGRKTRQIGIPGEIYKNWVVQQDLTGLLQTHLL